MTNISVAEYRKLKAMNKPNKYRNIKTGWNDSIKENKRANELRLMQKAWIISGLREQVWFTLQDAFEHKGTKYRAIRYKADFVYEKDWETIVEDVKSPVTRKLQSFKDKMKMFIKRYPNITFIIT